MIEEPGEWRGQWYSEPSTRYEVFCFCILKYHLLRSVISIAYRFFVVLHFLYLLHLWYLWFCVFFVFLVFPESYFWTISELGCVGVLKA